MSTVKAANLQNTGSGAPTFKNSSGTEIGQLCKAWVNFNGTGTVAIRDDFNVTSITDHGTGVYGVNFTNNMADANYCFSVNTGDTFNIDVSAFTASLTDQSASQLNMTCRYSSSDANHERDCEIVCASFFQN